MLLVPRDGEAHLVHPCEVADSVDLVVDRETDDDETTIAVLLLQLLEHRERTRARCTPRRPEVDHRHLVAKETDLLWLERRVERETRRRLTERALSTRELLLR